MYGALQTYARNQGLTSLGANDFALNAIATSVFNTSLTLGGSESVFQRQTIPCAPDTNKYGLFQLNAGCIACQASRTEFEQLRNKLEVRSDCKL